MWGLVASRRTDKRPPYSRSHPTFTLIELLVVVAIIGMLISVLLPSLSRARQQARAVQCQAHLRELGHGMIIYYSEWGYYPAHLWPSAALGFASAATQPLTGHLISVTSTCS
jgi:prepilin-type N-terminal cleavage/methylation domain-containing protein